MTEVVSLVIKPTVDDEIRQDIIGMLKRALEQAEAGEIDTVFMIVIRPDGTWNDRCGGLTRYGQTIGCIETIKQKMIHNYLRQEDDL